MSRRVLQILWPAFLMAAVFEVLLFGWLDPAALHGEGWPRVTVCSITFLVCWSAMSLASALTVLLLRAPPAHG